MKQNSYHGEWAGCSDLQKKREELTKAHEQFQISELKKRLDNGYQITGVKVKSRRPRIKKEKQPRQVVVSLGGEWTVKMTFAEYQQRGAGLKIVMKIF